MSGPLDSGIEDLRDAIDDFRVAGFQEAESHLARLKFVLASEPLAGFLRSALPEVEFEKWLDQAMKYRGSMVGSGKLSLPPERSARVALQVRLICSLAEGKPRFLDFVHHFFYSGYNNLTSHVVEFVSRFLDPFLRDLARLAEDRPLPPVIFEAMGALPPTGDAILDRLLRAAVTGFRDADPNARRTALEKLWDAWERLKSLDVPDNKKLSVDSLLNRATQSGPFRELLSAESRALTDIGNAFHIRHFEVDREELTHEREVEYLFMRMFSLIYLLLYRRE